MIKMEKFSHWGIFLVVVVLMNIHITVQWRLSKPLVYEGPFPASYPIQTVLSIDPNDFEMILNTGKPFWHINDSGKEPHWLDSTWMFLITFDFNDSDNSFLQLMRICQATADYNQRHLGNFTVDIVLLWISLIPHGDFTSQVIKVVSFLSKLNDENGPVAPIYMVALHYRAIRVGPQTLPLINKDIQSTANAIKTNGNQINFGVVFDVKNCYGSDAHFRMLELGAVDIVIFMPYTEMRPKSTLLSQLLLTELCVVPYDNYYKHLQGFGIGTAMSLNINMDKHLMEIQGNPVARVPTTKNGKVLYNIVGVQTPKNAGDKGYDDPQMQTKETQHRWLQLPPEFNRQVTGVSVFTSYRDHAQGMVIPYVRSMFCKILIAQRVSESRVNSLHKFINEFSDYKTIFMRHNETIKECRNSGSVLMISVNMFVDKSDNIIPNVNHTNELQEVIRILNDVKVHHGIKTETALLFNWNVCHNENKCVRVQSVDESIMKNDFRENHFKLVRYFENLRALNEKIQFSRSTRLGIIVEWQSCFTLLQYSSNYNIFLTKHLDILVFKIYVHQQHIIHEGAMKAVSRIIENLQFCSVYLQALKNARIEDGWNFSIKHAYFVSIYGCNSKISDLKEFMEITRFWELISYWAQTLDTTIYIGSAVEGSSNLANRSKMPNECEIKDAYESVENCDCGWWTTVSNETSVLKDRKSLSLELFQAVNKPHPSTETDSGWGLVLEILFPTVIFLIFVGILSAILIYRYRSKHRLSNEEAKLFFRGRHTPKNVDGEMDSARNHPYDRKRFEISRSCFKINTTNCLGSGEFGNVFSGTISRNRETIDVAVKMVTKRGIGNSHGDFLALTALIAEIKNLSYLGEHAHIVKLYGAYTEKLKSGKLFVFLELCSKGSLLKYLRNCQNSLHPGLLAEGSEITSQTITNELSQDLHRWSVEICSGMEFLAIKKLVHADLATRNVLLTATKSAKLSDFGLSRRLYEYTEYVKEVAGPLPWRWMAPESLTKMIFTEKSDVWAFGITLWEIFALGDEPYPGLSWSMEFPSLLNTGIVLECPRNANNGMYSIMKQCWNLDPRGRPSFSELTHIFSVSRAAESIPGVVENGNVRETKL